MAKAGSQVDPASFTGKSHRRSSTGGVNLEERNPISSHAPPLPLPHWPARKAYLKVCLYLSFLGGLQKLHL